MAAVEPSLQLLGSFSREKASSSKSSEQDDDTIFCAVLIKPAKRAKRLAPTVKTQDSKSVSKSSMVSSELMSSSVQYIPSSIRRFTIEYRNAATTSSVRKRWRERLVDILLTIDVPPLTSEFNRFQILQRPLTRLAVMAAITNANEVANEIIPRIWLGNRNAALNQDGWLERHDIQAVFNATKDIPFADGLPTTKYRIPVDDNLEDAEIANMAKWSPEIIYNVLQEYQAGRTILVHCAAGMQRSAAIVAMTLIALYGMRTDEAIDYIKSRRKIAFYPGANFYKSIQTFEQYFTQVLKPQLYAAVAATASRTL